jgi:hypothetical protein
LKEIFSLRNSGERFSMLNEIYEMFRAKGLEPFNLFRSLLKAYSCELWFEFGDASILLEREKTENSSSQEDAEMDACEDVIKISVALEKNHASKSITYKYRPSEFSHLFQTSYTKEVSETELAPKRKMKRIQTSTSRIDNAKIKTSNRITSYLARTNRVLSVSKVSKKLAISYQKTMDALLSLESLGLVEQVLEKHGKKEYRFVKLTQKGKRLGKISR